MNNLIAIFATTRTHLLARFFSILFLLAAITHGTLHGGILDYEGGPLRNISGKLASLVGMAAEDIRVSGLTHHDPELVFHALGVRPGASLVGFDAAEARRTLEAMDWVAAATVQRQYPNRLDINVAERVPFAIWQHEGTYSLIDRAGIAMGGMELMAQSHLLLVTGEGANFAAEELVNQLEANPELKKKVSAAAMVGKRRWTLYLQNGVKIALPSDGEPEALKQVSDLDASQNILSKGIREIDMRIAGKMTVAIAEIEETKDLGASNQKVSQTH